MSMNELDSFVLSKLAEYKTAGACFALINDGNVVYQKGYGFRDVEAALPCTPKTNISIASVTKSFTALAIMILAENGHLNVDDPVKTHIPEFNIQPDKSQILIRHLLSHSSGIPSLASSEMEWSALTGASQTRFPLASHDSLVAYGSEANDWLIASPGKEMRYCNYGFHLLGAIIERRSKMSYEDFVDNNILKPLQMDKSYFSKTHFDTDLDSSSAYVLSKGERKKILMPFRAVTAAGGLFSNVHDLSRYIRMYLNGGQLENVRVVSQASLSQMTASHIALPKDGPWNQTSYCFGLMRTDDFFGQTVIEHGGGQPFATSYIAWIPESGKGVAFLQNGGGYSTWRFAQIALAILLSEDWRELPFIRRERILDSLAGNYEAYRSVLRYSVRRAGDQLYLEHKNAHHESSIPLLAEQFNENEYKFLAPVMGEKMPITFIHTKQHIDLHMDRYLFRKKS